jgi:prepilin-type N-terminal cleavage/methylation domain-containing protein/prepilin-type processing-associated H-X9-DG protein
MRHSNREGFTLIELLIVFAVIAIIAAILFPTFAQAREKARQAACLSNLHQIGLASQMYTDDYDDTFLWNPGTFMTGSAMSQLILSSTHERLDCVDQFATPWIVLLDPYLKSRAVFHCPSFPGYSIGWPAEPSARSILRIDGIGYAHSPLQFGDPCRPHPVAWLRHPPSQVALFADVGTTWGQWVWGVSTNVYPLSTKSYTPDGKAYWAWDMYELPVPDPSMEPYTRRRHLDGYNFAFADGHAKFLRPIQVGRGGMDSVGGLGTDRAFHPGRVYRIQGYFPGALAD